MNDKAYWIDCLEIFVRLMGRQTENDAMFSQWPPLIVVPAAPTWKKSNKGCLYIHETCPILAPQKTTKCEISSSKENTAIWAMWNDR